jgi:opacity protein-like surface antigen
VRDRLRFACFLFAFLIAWPSAAGADEGQDTDKDARGEPGQEASSGPIETANDAPSYARRGFYVGIGGTAAFPRTWNSGFDDDLNEDVSEISNANANINRATIPTQLPLEELSVRVNGADLEDALLGVNGLIGYRVGEKVALEIEAEWLIDSNDSNIDVTSQTEENNLASTSTGIHRAEIEDIWTITANLKVYPPLTGRIQPFVKVGIGMQHSKLDVDIATTGLATLTNDQAQMLVVPADFQFRARETNVDGAVRVAGGVDIYATPHILAEINVGYVAPFAKVGSVFTEFLAVQWRLIYRF